jgi:hypothetical protein
MDMNLLGRNDQELNDMAKRLKVEFPKGSSREDKQDLLELEMLKRKKEMELKASCAVRSDHEKSLGLRGNIKTQMSPEEIIIKDSPKVRVVFYNREQPGHDDTPGASIPFTKGSIRFCLYDGQTHVMPLVFVVDKPDENEQCKGVLESLKKYWGAVGIKPTSLSAVMRDKIRNEEGIIARDELEYRAKKTLRDNSLVNRCNRPKTKMVQVTPEYKISKKVGEIPRFMFNLLGPADDAVPFGLVGV